MKKSKILVPAVALLALGMAASTTATVAWFSSGNAGHTEQSASQTLTVVENDLQIGGVSFNAEKGTPVAPSLELSDDNGVTYYTNGGHNYVKPNVEFSDTYAVIPVKVTVNNVSGGDTFANKIATLTGSTIELNVEGHFDTHDDADEALKFKVSAAPSKTANGWKAETVTGIKDYTVTGEEDSGDTIIAEFNVYVGIDGTNQYATDDIAEEGITITMTPVFTAAA